MCFYFCTFLFLNKQLDKDERISTNAMILKVFINDKYPTSLIIAPPKKANVFYIAMGYKIYIKYSVLPLEKFEFDPILICTK